MTHKLVTEIEKASKGSENVLLPWSTAFTPSEKVASDLVRSDWWARIKKELGDLEDLEVKYRMLTVRLATCEDKYKAASKAIGSSFDKTLGG